MRSRALFLLSTLGAAVAALAGASGDAEACGGCFHEPSQSGDVITDHRMIFRVTPDLGMFERPKLFLTGEYDEVSPRYKLEPWLERLPNRRLSIISGARHLMRGYESIASGTIAGYLVRWASTPGM